MYSGSLFSIRKGLMLCPYCGIELVSPIPSVAVVHLLPHRVDDVDDGLVPVH